MSEHKPSSPGIQPWDSHNQELISQVRPPDWTHPKPAAQYDLVVLGAGTAGLVTAAGAAGLGARVALVEKHLLGGDCLNVGCVPSKAMISSARQIAAVHAATGARASAPPITGLGSIPYLTNETVFSLTERPQCFGILSAGPIGCEMAQTFARLGSKVSLVETAHGLPPREDREAAAVVRESLARDGVTLLKTLIRWRR